jgi:phosphatidylglycerophosphatase A
MTRSLRDKLILFVAEGFGSGKIPFAPGTWGSLVGLLWIWLLLLPQNSWVYLGGIVLGFFVAVWVGGEAEKILGLTDPGRIVIDEIAAMPLVFWGAFAFDFPRAPSFESFFQSDKWYLPVAAFALFRLFDVWKPLGIRKIQHLPGGWGLAIDDYLAAILGFVVMLLIRHFS